MQKKYMIFTVILLAGLLAGCAAKKAEEKVMPVAEQKEVTQETELKTPDWFLNLPSDNENFYAATTALGWDLQNAINMAKQDALTDIAGQVSVHVSSMFKRFREEVVTEETAELQSQTNSVSKSVVDETISGCQIVKQDKGRENGKFRVYILMKMPKQTANASMISKIKADKGMYALFRASQGFQELETEVQKSKG
ncbi:hypothetical protein GF312_11055 [Candidatus Poribacteria bacterium]|nr:hypothetical protein [Candidatus Poribacteria bacterium]